MIADSTTNDDDDDDVVFVREEKASEAEIAKARSFLLPDNFYLYLYKPPCPGCIGCWDDEDEETTPGKSTAKGKFHRLTGARGTKFHTPIC